MATQPPTTATQQHTLPHPQAPRRCSKRCEARTGLAASLLQQCAAPDCDKYIHLPCCNTHVIQKHQLEPLVAPDDNLTSYLVVWTKKCYDKYKKTAAASTEARRPWDKDSPPGSEHTSESILLHWLLVEGNYDKFRGSIHSGGWGKNDFAQLISDLIKQKINVVRTKKQVLDKIGYIERTFRAAHDFANTATGEGLREKDVGSFRDKMTTICKWYYEIADIMLDRSSARPDVTNKDLDSSDSDDDSLLEFAARGQQRRPPNLLLKTSSDDESFVGVPDDEETSTEESDEQRREERPSQRPTSQETSQRPSQAPNGRAENTARTPPVALTIRPDEPATNVSTDSSRATSNRNRQRKRTRSDGNDPVSQLAALEQDTLKQHIATSKETERHHQAMELFASETSKTAKLQLELEKAKYELEKTETTRNREQTDANFRLSIFKEYKELMRSGISQEEIGRNFPVMVQFFPSESD